MVLHTHYPSRVVSSPGGLFDKACGGTLSSMVLRTDMGSDTIDSTHILQRSIFRRTGDLSSYYFRFSYCLWDMRFVVVYETR